MKSVETDCMKLLKNITALKENKNFNISLQKVSWDLHANKGYLIKVSSNTS